MSPAPVRPHGYFTPPVINTASQGWANEYLIILIIYNTAGWLDGRSTNHAGAVEGGGGGGSIIRLIISGESWTGWSISSHMFVKTKARPCPVTGPNRKLLCSQLLCSPTSAPLLGKIAPVCIRARVLSIVYVVPRFLVYLGLLWK